MGFCNRTWFFLKAQVCLWTGRASLVEQLCRARLAVHEKEYLTTLFLARALYHQNRWPEAAEIYRHLTELPSSRSFLDIMEFVEALYRAKHYSEVISTGENALNALAYSSLGFEQQLFAFFSESLHRLIGYSFAALGKYKEAIPHLKKAINRPSASNRQEVERLLDSCRGKT